MAYCSRRSRCSPFYDLHNAPHFSFVRYNPSGSVVKSRRPALDWQELDKSYEVQVELPGVKREAIKLQFSEDGSVLTISGHTLKSQQAKKAHNSESSPTEKDHEHEKDHEKEQDHEIEQEDSTSIQNTTSYSERLSGSFSRSIKFSSRVQVERTTASLKDGVLSVHVPKHESTGAHDIVID